MKKTHEKEVIYDEKLSKLVRQIADICDKHNLAYVMTFDIGDGGACTSINCSEATNAPSKFNDIGDILLGNRGFSPSDMN